MVVLFPTTSKSLGAGGFLPFLRAFDSPIAMACLRFFTLPLHRGHAA